MQQEKSVQKDSPKYLTMLGNSVPSKQEAYAMLRKYMTRSMAGDRYAESQIMRLAEKFSLLYPNLYENALNDCLAELCEIDFDVMGEPLREIIRVEYTDYDSLNEFWSLYKPIEPQEQTRDFKTFCISNNLNPDKVIIFPVTGYSMIGAGINNGDMVIVDSSRIPTSGEIGAVYINDGYFIKRIDISGGRVTLISENSDFKPYTVSQVDEFKLIGVATNLIKSLKQQS